MDGWAECDITMVQLGDLVIAFSQCIKLMCLEVLIFACPYLKSG